jgi:beta-ribofuranosylaminobenzene 5'-phosphate synthase
MGMTQLPAHTADAALGEGVRVSAPGRLHFGFLDPAGHLGRRFGSLGLVIDGVDTELELRRAAVDQLQAEGPSEQAALRRAATLLATLREATGQSAPVQLTIRRVPPAHAGFGTGTQLALALGHAFSELFGLGLSSPALAQITHRGLRSGIGIAGFDAGGLLLDGGPAGPGRPAPLLARVELPEAWRVLLVLDPRSQGLSGTAERAALATLAPLPEADAARLCHEVLMRVLPAAADGDFDHFATGLTRMQRLLGAFFAPAQQGRAYTSAAVGHLLEGLAARQPAAIGQSSWGPTGFAVLPSQAAVDEALAAVRGAGLVDAGLLLRSVRPLAHGATRTVLAAGA